MTNVLWSYEWESMHGFIPHREPMTAESALQRARGKVSASFRRSADGNTQVSDLFQEGSLKARLPRPQCDYEADLVLINIAGGVTGGDRLSVKVSVGEGACVTVTTPGCERIYRALDGEALIDQRLRVGRGARLDWIPQETILFDRSRMRRRLDVQLDAGAEITVAEAILFGRTAMGETVNAGFLSDFWTLSRDGCLLFADATRIAGSINAIAACSTTLGCSRAMATLLHVGRDPAAKRDALRTRFAQCAEATAGASVVGNVLVARIVASDSITLRRALIPALACLRATRPLPRLWFC